MPKIIAVTHNGAFHADDVFSAALLSILYGDDLEIVRTRDPEKIRKADIVFDVGGTYEPENNRFDHHQDGGAGSRDNGIPYASIGILWKKFGLELCSRNIDISDIVDSKLIAPIDAWDNGFSLGDQKIKGIFPYTISLFINSLNPSWQELDTYDECFRRAVSFALPILQREIKTAFDAVAAKKAIFESYKQGEDPRVLVLDKQYPWYEGVKELSEVLFVVYPRRSDGSWAAKAVPANGEFDLRCTFPEAWSGRMGKDLAVVSGVADAIFVHRTLGMAYAQSREGVLSLVKLALDKKTR